MLLLPMLFTDVQAPWTGLGQGWNTAPSLQLSVFASCRIGSTEVVQTNKQKQPKFNY